jgi:two-component system response regulator FlrC
MIALSRKAAEENPALSAWLSGAGLAPTLFDAGEGWDGGPAIYAAAERSRARNCDLLVEFVEGEPSLAFAENAPTLIRFGYDDLAFGNALVAELVRPSGIPACGEPDSVRLIEFVRKIAASEVSVLVLGETGTGKEGIARAIHAASPRAAGPFIAVNCAALPETMLEAILFGHRKGSFTGAASEGEGLFRAADRGTLLLDEISELPLALQAKLLRALQEREVLPVGAVRPEPVDVRVVACANRDLADEVAAGRFRADLYWRLNVVPVALRPLRARRLDVRAIAAALLLRHHRPDVSFPFPTSEALDLMMRHSWPGNVRELDNVIQRALLLRAGARIDVDALAIDPVRCPAGEGIRPLADAARSAEEQVIRDALAEAGGHRSRAAERLGISERTLRYRLAGMRAAAA